MMNRGTGQTDRYLKALGTDFFSIDKRNLNDFVSFVSKYSNIINFFNSDNNPDGNWSTFFENDVTILLIQISSINIIQYEKDFESLKYKADNIYARISFLCEILDLIENWKNKLTEIEDFKNEITKLIKFKLNKVAQKVFEFEETAIQNQLCKKNNTNYEFKFSNDWQSNSYFDDEFLFENETIEDRKKEANIFLDNCFINIKNSLQLIIESAKNYADKKISESADNKPYITLFIAFTEIYKEAQKEINKFTERHLKYHFYDILKFKKLNENPDSVFVNFVIQEALDNTIIPKNTLLNAGADAEGNNIYYATDDELIVTKAQISEIKAIVNHDKKDYQKNYTNNDVLFLTKELNKNINIEEAENKTFSLGFAIASSFLKLEEGERTLKFNFDLHRFSFENFKNDIIENIFADVNIEIFNFDELTKNIFHFSYSYVEGETQKWFYVPLTNINTYFKKSSEGNILHNLIVEVRIEDVFPPIDNCISDAYYEVAKRNLPVVKFFINNDKLKLYNYLKQLVIDKLHLEIEAVGVKNLKLQNDFGVIDKNTPFEPFGPIPTIGSNFYIGHETIFSRQLDDLHINFEWHDVPLLDYGFAEYYDGYSYIESNDVFKAKLSILYNKKWYPADNQQIISLFEDVDMEGEPITPVNNFRIIDDIDIEKINTNYKGKLPVFNNDYFFASSTRNGYIKLEFCYPPNGFGNKEYPEIIKNSMTGSIKKKIIPETPNEPWIPTLKSVSVNFASSITIDFNNQEPKNKTFFYEIHPFGEIVVSETIGKQLNILPFYEIGSELYLGIENFNKLDTFSIFFNINMFASDYIKEKNEISWSILIDDEWISLKDDNILKDSTNELMNSGIVTFNFANFSKNKISTNQIVENKLFPSGLFWIKSKSIFDEQFIYNILDVKCQAVTATFVSNENNLEHLKNPLKPNTIQSFVDEQPDIVEIQQKLSSFNGKAKESDTDFYIRVSERLRHKNRAVINWDYERIILQNFPEVSKVVCLSNKNQHIKFEPGAVTIVVLPDVSKIVAEHVYKPKFSVSKLNQIKKYLKEKISPFINLNVCNPIYEKIQVKFEVKFYDGLNDKFYLQKANEDIKKFINPWLFDEDVNVAFSNKIYGSHILYYLETRDYIDYISNFTIYHINNENIINFYEASDKDVVLTPKTEVSIFVSSENHIISIIGEQNEAETLEAMALEADFTLKNENLHSEIHNNEKIEIDFTIHKTKISENKNEKISINIDNFDIT